MILYLAVCLITIRSCPVAWRFSQCIQSNVHTTAPPTRTVLINKQAHRPWLTRALIGCHPFTFREIVSQLELEENNSCLFLSVGDFLDLTYCVVAFIVLLICHSKTPDTFFYREGSENVVLLSHTFFNDR